MPVCAPSSSILLIEPAPALCEIIQRCLPAAIVDSCSSLKEAVKSIRLNSYQVVICPQRIASLNGYSLLSLNRLHNPCSPFIVTTERKEVADVRQAIEHGALGFLHGTATTSKIISIVEGLLALYRLRASLEDRMKWATNFRDHLRRSPPHRKSPRWSGIRPNDRVMCKQSLTVVEGSMQTFQAQANHLVSEARQRMWDT